MVRMETIQAMKYLKIESWPRNGETHEQWLKRLFEVMHSLSEVKLPVGAEIQIKIP